MTASRQMFCLVSVMLLLYAAPHDSLPMKVLPTSHGIINQVDDIRNGEELLRIFGETEQEITPYDLHSNKKVSKLLIRAEATTLPEHSNGSGSNEDGLAGNDYSFAEATNTPIPLLPSDLTGAAGLGTSFCTRPLRDCYRRERCFICIDRERWGRPPCSQAWKNSVVTTCKRACGNKVVVCFW